jgi:hypothetical protein
MGVGDPPTQKIKKNKKTKMKQKKNWVGGTQIKSIN